MAKQLTFDLTTNETISLKVKVRKDLEPTLNLIKEFFEARNPNTEVTNDVIIEKAIIALSIHPDIKKFSAKDPSDSIKKSKKSLESTKESA